MAHYLVTAKPKTGRLEDLLANLRRDVYASMRPFGRALTYSLQNARLREDGNAVWEEEDYCSPPLAQERAAALDEFFDEPPALFDKNEEQCPKDIGSFVTSSN